MSTEFYRVGGPDWVDYFDNREEALEKVRKLHRIPAGQPFAGTYGVETVTDPTDKAIAREHIARRKRKSR